MRPAAGLSRRCGPSRAVVWAFALIVCIGLPAPGIAAEPEPDGDGLRHALSLYDTQQYAEAIVELKAVYVAHPRAEILYMLGQAYRLDGNCASAIKAYRSFLRSEPPPRQVKATRKQIKNCQRLLAEGAAEKADPQPAGAAEANAPPAGTSAPARPTPREDAARAGGGEAAASSNVDPEPLRTGSGPEPLRTGSGPDPVRTDSGQEPSRADLGPDPPPAEARPLRLTDRLGVELMLAAVAALGASAAFGVAEKLHVDASARATNYGDFDRSYRGAQDARRVWPWLLGSGAVLLIAGLIQQFVIVGPRAAEETIGVSGPGGSVLWFEPY
jgi:hypothetical protein